MRLYDEFWYSTQDGLKLFARDYRGRDSGGQRLPTILCIPGLTRNSKDFAVLAEQLPDDFRIIAPDLRGRGRSECDLDPTNYHPGTYVQDMLALVAALELESVLLIGTSLGGIVSMMLCAIDSDRFVAAVVNDIGAEVEQVGLSRIRDYVSGSRSMTSWKQAVELTRETLADAHPNFSPEDWLSFTRNLYKEDSSGVPVLDYDPKISVLVKQSEEEPTPDLWPVWAAIRSVPILLIRGELSDVLSEDCARKMQENHNEMRYCEIPDVGHAPLLTEPEAIVQVIAFLKDNSSKDLL